MTTYANHFFSANGKGQTLCNQKSKDTVVGLGTQDTTKNAAEVTCKKCLLLLAASQTTARTPVQIAAHDKKIRAAAREVKSLEADLARFDKKPHGGMPGVTPEMVRANYAAMLSEARAALAKLEA